MRTSTSLCACLWYMHHYSVCVLGVAVQHAGKWPDLMTSKLDSVSTLGYHWTDHTGTPLEPQVHWDATGTTLAEARTQWCPSGDPVFICIIRTRWKATGRPLEAHWKHNGNRQFFLKWLSGVHWGLRSRYTIFPLDYHWLRVRLSTATTCLVATVTGPTDNKPSTRQP